MYAQIDGVVGGVIVEGSTLGERVALTASARICMQTFRLCIIIIICMKCYVV